MSEPSGNFITPCPLKSIEHRSGYPLILFYQVSQSLWNLLILQSTHQSRLKHYILKFWAWNLLILQSIHQSRLKYYILRVWALFGNWYFPIEFVNDGCVGKKSFLVLYFLSKRCNTLVVKNEVVRWERIVVGFWRWFNYYFLIFSSSPSLKKRRKKRNSQNLLKRANFHCGFDIFR